MISNNVTRYLDSRKIKYRIFELPGEKLAANEVARILGAAPEIVFKSIVITRKSPGKPILAVVPGNKEVDLKKLARAVGEKKVSAATQKEAENLTNLQTGGISPLALINKGFTIVIHKSILDHEQIHISGGERALNLRLAAKDLVSILQARVADIS